MSDLGDRRAQKKAQTRELVRTTAHRLFAERGFDSVTIADVAREADVAVQTVFNHFATKEDLFFDGRAPWVQGVADAVRHRAPGVGPLSALRAHLLEFMTLQLSSLTCPDERCYRETLEASETLRTYERTLVFEAEHRLSDALLDAWRTPVEDGEPTPVDPAITAPLTAAIWLAAVRVLIVENRLRVAEGLEPTEVACTVEVLGDRLLGYMQARSGTFHGLVDRSLTGATEDRRAV
ncbi:TetR/AcrR family transcriptional regulator [Blastococcus aurantiacus]|uniref:TetR/AcrR family transcriptional regulator n=1 Tax=Blastococcus aurantiacus TaxID=1550231 RepID=UPI001C40AC52|nr:TetR/AcrR family transcriptional regulator [Blastococcus aurantiacus]